MAERVRLDPVSSTKPPPRDEFAVIVFDWEATVVWTSFSSESFSSEWVGQTISQGLAHYFGRASTGHAGPVETTQEIRHGDGKASFWKMRFEKLVSPTASVICMARKLPDLTTPLTDRETAVMKLFSTGADISDIAKDLGITINTVNTHIAKLKEKTGTRSLRELLVFSIKHLASGF